MLKSYSYKYLGVCYELDHVVEGGCIQILCVFMNMFLLMYEHFVMAYLNHKVCISTSKNALLTIFLLHLCFIIVTSHCESFWNPFM
jgi:hypothetical protein